MSIGALWILVLFETVLLLLLLRALGELRQKGMLLSGEAMQSSALGGLEVGEQAPSFTASDQDGNVIELEDIKKRRVLAFVSPSCSACDSTLQVLKTVKQDQRVEVVLVVGSSNSEENRRYAAKHDLQMPLLTPGSEVVEGLYHVHGFPLVFVLDEVGMIRAKGGVNHEKQLRDLLDVAFALVSAPH